MNRQLIESEFRRDPGLHLQRPELKALLALWRDLKGERAVVDRAAFDPTTTLRPYLARVLIHEMVGTPPAHRFRFRLYGTRIAQFTGRDSTGRFVDETVMPSAAQSYHDIMTWVATEARPLRVTGTLHYHDRSFLKFETLCLLLSVGGPEIRQVLCVVYYHNEA